MEEAIWVPTGQGSAAKAAAQGLPVTVAGRKGARTHSSSSSARGGAARRQATGDTSTTRQAQAQRWTHVRAGHNGREPLAPAALPLRASVAASGTQPCFC